MDAPDLRNHALSDIDGKPVHRYSTLGSGESRLLYAENVNGSVTWSLRPAPLFDQSASAIPPFVALSYTWGDLGHTFPFICNNQVLHIHANLRDALPYLARRCIATGLPIWIDAVCIDQANDAEKLFQIRNMKHIYDRAKAVWAWLGPSNEYTAEGVALLPSIAKLVELPRLPQSAWIERPHPSTVGLPSFSLPVWVEVAGILENPWFRRMWIIQEACLARSLVVIRGEHELQWETLRGAIEAIHNQRLTILQEGGTESSKGLTIADILQPRIIAENTTIMDFRKELQQAGQNKNSTNTRFSLSLQLLVGSIGTFGCYEPRDRVLALLGLIGTDKVLDGLSADAPTVSDLYTNFCRFLVFNEAFSSEEQKHVALHLLYLATSFEKLDGLPSWVLDLHHQDRKYHCKESVYQPGDNKSPRGEASNKPFVIRKGIQDDQIIMCAVALDQVEEVFPEMPQITEDEIHIDLLNLYEWELAMTSVFVTAPDLEDSYWRTLIGNRMEGEHGPARIEDLYDSRKALRRFRAFADKYDGIEK